MGLTETLTETSWHGIRAWKLEDDILSVVVVPDLGAKIASIYDKKAGREWLLGPIRAVRPAPYAANYIDYDVSGWDEMFPTCQAQRLAVQAHAPNPVISGNDSSAICP